MEASDCDRTAVWMAAGAQSSLTGTNFQYHLEGDCSGSKGRKAGEEVSRAGPRVEGRDTHFLTVLTGEEGCPEK